MNARDAGGNTPLMSAAICGRSKMLETFLRDVERAKQVSISPTFYEHLFPICKFFFVAFMCLQFVMVIFWQKESSAKAELKILVTSG